jgi:hypothetical protein
MAEITTAVIHAERPRLLNSAAFWQKRGTWLEFDAGTDDITSVSWDAFGCPTSGA